MAELPKVVKKGEAVPEDGMLFSIPQANDLYKEVTEGKANKEVIKSYEKSLSITQGNLTITEKKVTILDQRNDELAQRLRDSQGMNNIERMIWVGAGIIATVGAGYALSRMK